MRFGCSFYELCTNRAFVILLLDTKARYINYRKDYEALR